MYQREDQARSERHGPDGPGRVTPQERARHALARIEQALTTAPVDLVLDHERLRAALQGPLADPELEHQRAFALGWLAWLGIHITFLTTFRNRLSALLTWTLAFGRESRRERAFTMQQIVRGRDIYTPQVRPDGQQSGGRP